MNWNQTGWAVFAIIGLLSWWASIRDGRKCWKLLREVEEILDEIKIAKEQP